MRTYFKAYLLRDLRQFADWSEPSAPAGVALHDDLEVYLCDDYAVVLNPFADHHEVLFSSQNEEWTAFCRKQLDFQGAV